MAMSEGKLERCAISIDEHGNLIAHYRWSHLQVDGSFAHDEDVSDWTDDEIKGLVADMIGADSEDQKVMEIER